MNLADQIGDRAGNSRVRVVLATCTSIDWGTQIAMVSIQGNDSISARISGQAPILQSPVWVLIADDIAVTLGRPVRPPMATVSGSPSAGLVDVLSDDGNTYRVGFQTGYTPSTGHRVLMNWDGGGHIVIRVDQEIAPPPPPPPSTVVVSKAQQFAADRSGSHRRGGSWQDGSVYFGSSFDTSGYFYGSKIADSIPDNAIIDTSSGTGIHVYLEVLQASGAGSMQLYLHTSGGVPGGALALDQAVDIGSMPAGFRGDVPLPTSWADQLKTGARLGIGTTGPGLRVLKGVNAQAAAGAITIRWKE